jgi:hypothetical protein
MTLTIDGTLRQKVKQAQDLMRHKARKGDLAVILEKALDLLIAKEKKERFGIGRNPRPKAPTSDRTQTETRHIPDDMKRTIYERDGGQCTFVGEQGRRCTETGGVELDLLDGWAKTHEHSVDRIVLKCRSHNAHAAEKMYGREK